MVYMMTPQERAKDKRLWKAYRWTLAMYNALGEKQGWRCAICGRAVKEAPLQVDHKHFKIWAIRGAKSGQLGWFAEVAEYDVFEWAKTKVGAVRLAREKALPLSVRGLLCPGQHGTGCNTKLGRVDKPEWLAKALEYVTNPPAKTLDFKP